MASTLFGQWSEVKVYPFSGDILGFYMSDSSNITAVIQNDSSSVIKSTDGGRNWYVSESIPRNDLLQAKFVDELNIFLNIDTCILKTTNGGVTWSIITVPTQIINLFSLHVFDPNTIYTGAIYQTNSGLKYRMIRSLNGGDTWARMDTSVPYVNTFTFFNKDTGWAFGGYIYRTTNGGTTFTSVPIPDCMQNPVSIDILDNSTLVMSGARYQEIFPGQNYPRPIMAFSTNGGSIWRCVDLGFYAFWGEPWLVKLLNDRTAVALLRGATRKGVIYTTDKGVNWHECTSPLLDFLYKDIQIHDNKVYLAGEGTSFLVSERGGIAKWDVRSEQKYSSNTTAAFLDPGYVFVADEAGKIHTSTDRGLNWHTRKIPKGKASVIEPVNDSLIYLVSGSTIYKSIDLCTTFDSVAISPNTDIYELFVSKNGTIWISTGSSLYSSINGGYSWDLKFSTSSIKKFNKVVIFDDGTGYTSNDVLYKTSDHGNTWNQTIFQPFTADGFDFLNSNTGLITGPSGNIYLTHNGGSTYSEIVVPGMYFPELVYMKDEFNFFARAYNLHSTYDGGMMWKVNDFGNTTEPHQFQWMTMYDHFEGIGVSSGNRGSGIWKTSNRGNTPVELSSFKAFKFGREVKLNWTTETETNNMGFEIERRYTAGHWERIGTVKGNGTTTQKVYYSFDDYPDLNKGTAAYRLKQTDYNGEYRYSNEIEVILGEVPENYSIAQNYPNPFNPGTKVSFQLPEENEVVIRVFNTMGELVKEFNRGILPHGYFDQEIEMADAPSGVYVCQVFCTNTVTARTKSLTTKMVLLK